MIPIEIKRALNQDVADDDQTKLSELFGVTYKINT